jgi:hypothetical protein
MGFREATSSSSSGSSSSNRSYGKKLGGVALADQQEAACLGGDGKASMSSGTEADLGTGREAGSERDGDGGSVGIHSSLLEGQGSGPGRDRERSVGENSSSLEGQAVDPVPPRDRECSIGGVPLSGQQESRSGSKREQSSSGVTAASSDEHGKGNEAAVGSTGASVIGSSWMDMMALAGSQVRREGRGEAWKRNGEGFLNFFQAVFQVFQVVAFLSAGHLFNDRCLCISSIVHVICTLPFIHFHLYMSFVHVTHSLPSWAPRRPTHLQSPPLSRLQTKALGFKQSSRLQTRLQTKL